MGTFKINPTKPYRTVNGAGELTLDLAKRLPRPDEISDPIPLCSTRPSTANASPSIPQSMLNGMMVDAEIDRSDISNQLAADPMLAYGSEAMFSAFQSTRPANHSDDMSKPPGITYYPMSEDLQANSLFAAGNHDARDDDDDKEKLKLQELIDLSDEHEPMDNILPTPMSNSPTTASRDIQPRIPSPKASSSEVDEFMKCFDNGVVVPVCHVPAHGLLPHPTHVIKNGRHTPPSSLGSPSRKRKRTGTLSPTASGGAFVKKRFMQHH